jgi:hypothetical protein
VQEIAQLKYTYNIFEFWSVSMATKPIPQVSFHAEVGKKQGILENITKAPLGNRGFPV